MTETRPLDLRTLTRDQLLSDFRSAWSATDVLFSALRSEKAFLQPPDHGLRHPLIFYYGHAAVFYVNKLMMAKVITEPVDAAYEHLFAIGVDEHSWDDLNKTSSQWPSLAEASVYRERVRSLIESLIETHPDICASGAGLAELEESPTWAILMGIEHDRIHVETTSVLMRELPLQFLKRPAGFPALHPSADEPKLRSKEAWVQIPAGEVRLGKPADWPLYGWDNEYGEKVVRVPAFETSKHLITNADFEDFVKDGGYRRRELWSEEGWRWREFRRTTQPRFWTEQNLRTIFEEIPRPAAWPVIVNFHEAKAYANWRSELDRKPTRLISEGEHHRMRAVAEPAMADKPSFERWHQSNLFNGANFNLRFSSESSVEGDGAITDVFGNVWQWGEDIFEPLNGFRTHSLYEDYSTPSFDGRHQILLGGSFASSGAGTSPWVRNNFRRHFFQHAGFRLVRSL